MKICSKCNKEVTPGQLYCPRCGFSLIKNKYGERVGVGGTTSKMVSPEIADTINKTNMEHGNNGMQPRMVLGGNSTNSINSINNTNKNNTASAVTVVIIFIISTCIPLLITVFSSVDTNSNVVTITSKYDLDSVIDQVKVLADDNLNVRNYYTQNSNINLDVIADVTSLEKDNLNNTWCNWIASYNTEANAVLCTITAHSDLGDDEAAITSLADLSNSIDNLYEDVNYSTLISIHDTLNNLYYLSRNSYDTYSDYEEKYNTLNSNLNSYINNLG